MTALGGLLRAAALGMEPKYWPKFCRTRNCSLPFRHEGGHDGAPTSVVIPVRPARPTAPRATTQQQRRDSTRAKRARRDREAMTG